jgi:flagellar motor component MotA
MNKEQIFGIIRHLLTSVGGVIITNGYMSDGMLTEITGSIIAIVGVIWSVLSKKKEVEVK